MDYLIFEEIFDNHMRWEQDSNLRPLTPNVMNLYTIAALT